MRVSVRVNLKIYDKMTQKQKADYVIARVEDARDARNDPEQIMSRVIKRWSTLGKEYLTVSTTLTNSINDIELREKVDDVLCSIMRMFDAIIPFDIDFKKKSST